ncbi:hypothetical protein V5O48_009171 [Marasmius crinis-equi]|uniref:Uncharacterized protein n=1 Tax=Marasmius crinis-equi TaxID=585013 RepID=A0ABR3FC12_9AGAR
MRVLNDTTEHAPSVELPAISRNSTKENAKKLFKQLGNSGEDLLTKDARHAITVGVRTGVIAPGTLKNNAREAVVVGWLPAAAETSVFIYNGYTRRLALDNAMGNPLLEFQKHLDKLQKLENDDPKRPRVVQKTREIQDHLNSNGLWLAAVYCVDTIEQDEKRCTIQYALESNGQASKMPEKPSTHLRKALAALAACRSEVDAEALHRLVRVENHVNREVSHLFLTAPHIVSFLGDLLQLQVFKECDLFWNPKLLLQSGKSTWSLLHAIGLQIAMNVLQHQILMLAAFHRLEDPPSNEDLTDMCQFSLPSQSELLNSVAPWSLNTPGFQRPLSAALFSWITELMELFETSYTKFLGSDYMSLYGSNEYVAYARVLQTYYKEVKTSVTSAAAIRVEGSPELSEEERKIIQNAPALLQRITEWVRPNQKNTRLQVLAHAPLLCPSFAVDLLTELNSFSPLFSTCVGWFVPDLALHQDNHAGSNETKDSIEVFVRHLQYFQYHHERADWAVKEWRSHRVDPELSEWLWKFVGTVFNSRYTVLADFSCQDLVSAMSLSHAVITSGAKKEGEKALKGLHILLYKKQFGPNAPMSGPACRLREVNVRLVDLSDNDTMDLFAHECLRLVPDVLRAFHYNFVLSNGYPANSQKHRARIASHCIRFVERASSMRQVLTLCEHLDWMHATFLLSLRAIPGFAEYRYWDIDEETLQSLQQEEKEPSYSDVSFGKSKDDIRALMKKLQKSVQHVASVLCDGAMLGVPTGTEADEEEEEEEKSSSGPLLRLPPHVTEEINSFYDASTKFIRFHFP